MNDDDLEEMRRTFRSRVKRKIEEVRSESTDVLTLEDIAGEIGISYRYLIKILNHDTNVSLEVMLRLMDYFGVSFEWLVGMEEPDAPPLSEGALDRLAALASGDPGDDPLPDYFDPAQVGRRRTGDLRPLTFCRRFYPKGSTPEERRTIRAESILGTISSVIEDEELPALLDSYLHSVWGLEVKHERVARDVRPCEVDAVIARMLVDRLDAMRSEREARSGWHRGEGTAR